MKKCGKCGKSKDYDDFYKNKYSIDKLQYECKSCFNKRVKNIRRTKDGLISRIYSHQKGNSKRRGHNPPTYTKGELKDWLFNKQEFHELFYIWAESGYDKLSLPSCDRIDDYLSYSIDNIQLITWGENNIKGHNDRKNGINNKLSKAVLSINKITREEKEYYSISQASRETNIARYSIWNSCNDTSKLAGGCYWKFL